MMRGADKKQLIKMNAYQINDSLMSIFHFRSTPLPPSLPEAERALSGDSDLLLLLSSS
jgi:hypothetical protein